MTTTTPNAEAPGVPGPDRAAPGILLRALAGAVGPQHVLTDPDVLEQYRRDNQPLAQGGRPLAVVRPSTTDEVAAVVRACAAAGVPFVPRGAGSGMTGAANAVDGGVTVIFTRMNSMKIDPATRTATVQPGVVTLDLKDAAESHQLFYAPDPTSKSWCTIGGNIANGSGGPCGAKYGVTGDAVLGLEVVLASGDVLRTGRHTLKSVTGYDLTHLFVGSEGTLGIITEATLALRAHPAPTSTAVAVFDSVEAAAAAVTACIADGAPLSLLEIMDGPCIGAVEQKLGGPLLDGAPTPAAVLFAQSDSGSPEDLARFERASEAHGAIFVYQAEDEAEGEMLMQYWSSLEEALEDIGIWILHEVTVRPANVAKLITRAAEISAETGIFMGVHGHAADGTLHPMIVMEPGDAEASEKARQAYESILAAAVELGGPVTGEHGIGRMKKAQLLGAVGTVGLEAHRAVKRAFDPHNICNPGAMFDLEDVDV
jgi:glycolate oxidase